MQDTYEIGCCYEVTLTDGRTITFRFIGGESPQVESPPGSRTLLNFDALFTTFRDVRKVPCPGDAA